MSILGQKLQYMTEAYNDYSDPAYESYNADCGGGVLLEAESFDDMTDIIEACYKVDCKEISHLNNIMSLKESGASDATIADAKSEYEYIHEADSKATGEGIGAKLKKIWEKVKNFIFSIGRKIRSLFEDTKKTYDRYKDRIKGKSVTLQGYEYELEATKAYISRNLKDADIETVKSSLRPEKDDTPNDSDAMKKQIKAELRGLKADQEVKPHDVTLSGDTIGSLVAEVMTKKDIKTLMDATIKKINETIDSLQKEASKAQGDELAEINKMIENAHFSINIVNMCASEYNKAAKEANSLYNKAILMMVSGKTGKKKDKEEAKKEEETTQESYYFWD